MTDHEHDYKIIKSDGKRKTKRCTTCMHVTIENPPAPKKKSFLDKLLRR